MCIFRERRKKKKHGSGGVVGGGVRACLAQHFFFLHKGLSVLLASYSGRRPHDSPVPISRVTPQPQQQRLFLFTSASHPGSTTINPYVSDLQDRLVFVLGSFSAIM